MANETNTFGSTGVIIVTSEKNRQWAALGQYCAKFDNRGPIRGYFSVSFPVSVQICPMRASYTYALAMFQELWSLEYRLFFATFRNGRQMHWNHYITIFRSPRRLLNDMWQRPVPVSDGSAPATPLWLHVRFLWVTIMVWHLLLSEWMNDQMNAYTTHTTK